MALKTNLISVWEMNEASGNALDSHGSHNLTDNATVTAVTGLIDGARSFAAGSSEYFSLASAPNFEIGDETFQFAGWIYLTSIAVANPSIISKWQFSGGSFRSYQLWLNSTTSLLTFSVSNDGSTQTHRTAASFGALPTGGWYWVECGHDATANITWISVNNGTVDSTSHSTGINSNTTAPFLIGAANTGNTGYWNGRIDQVAFWRGRKLTDDEKAELYNGGFGKAYSLWDVVTDAITLSSPLTGGYQRDENDEVQVAVSGITSGTVTSVEYRWNGGAWLTLDASPAANAFSGTATLTKGQGVLDVRFGNSTGITDTSGTITVGDVYVIAGQSNAEGRGTNPQSHTGTYTLSCFREDDLWRHNNADPTDTLTAAGSCWPLLSTILESSESCPIIFITTAKGGAGLINGDWVKGFGGLALYENMLAQITSSGVNSVTAVLFHQGETDVNGDASVYATLLENLGDNIAADVAGSPPLICAAIGMHPVGAPNDIRIAQTTSWSAIGPILEGPTLLDIAVGGDSVHFADDADMQELANRWWIALQNGIYGGSLRKALVAVSIIATDTDEITITFDQTIQGSSLSTAPWKIGGDGTPPTVSSVAINSNNIVLTLSGALTTNPTVEFGFGNTASGVNIPRGQDVTIGAGPAVVAQPPRSFRSSVSSPSSGGSQNLLLMGVG